MTLVYNLATGETQYISGDPIAAVKEAYKQSCKRKQTYGIQVTESRQRVSCGYWTALKA